MNNEKGRKRKIRKEEEEKLRTFNIDPTNGRMAIMNESLSAQYNCKAIVAQPKRGWSLRQQRSGN